MLGVTLLSLAAELSRVGDASHELVIREIEGDLVCSVHARHASLPELLADIAERTGRSIRGLDAGGVFDPITVELDERPLNQVLHTLLGCNGLRARLEPGAIEVLADLDGRATAEELDEQAGIAWLRALQNHPEHALGAEAEMGLAEIQERKGNARTAAGHYDLVVRNWPESSLAPEALARSGAILEKNGEWNEAAARFTTLANLMRPHPHATKARLELARCFAESGDARQALFMLDALDRLFPDTLPKEKQARLFVRALALNAANRHADALRTLQAADSIAIEREWRNEALELRAEALEHFDRPAEAARMWLELSQLSRGKTKERALVNAARLAQEADDAIAVLMIQRAAVGTAATRAIEPLALAARESLGLQDPLSTGIATREVLQRAQDLLAAQLCKQASQTLDALYARRDQLDAPTFVLALSTYAQAVDCDRGLEPALSIIREGLRALSDVEQRKLLYVCAGELFEKHERYDEAIAAYGGSL